MLTDNNIVHLFEYEGNGGHWKIPIEILINRSVTRIRSGSLSGQVRVLTDKLTEMNELNEELETSQKENKHKMRTLKDKNKKLVKENENLKQEIETLKEKGTQSGGTNMNQNLLQAHDNYKALTEKYKILEAQMKSSNGVTNGSQPQQNNNNNVLDIMASVAPTTTTTTTAPVQPIKTAPVVAANVIAIEIKSLKICIFTSIITAIYVL